MEDAAGERGKDSLVGLPWQRPRAGLAEWSARPCRCVGEQLLDPSTRDEEKSVRRARAAHSEPPER